jgi:hypothetical protein
MPHARTHCKTFFKAAGLLCLGAAVTLCITAESLAQSLEDRLDEDAYLRGLVELRLMDVLNHYARTHQSADAFRNAQFEIAAQRIALTDPAATMDQRLATLDQLGKVRSQLAATHPNDSRTPVLLADQAADAFFDLLPTEAAGFTAIFGHPSAQQLSLARKAAREMFIMSTQAEQRVVQALRFLESQPGFATDFALQDQRRRLAEEQRDRRIPFLQGIAAFLKAELDTASPDERTQLCNQAVARLTPLVMRASTAPLTGPTLQRARLYLALALSRIGDLDAADDLLDLIIQSPGSEQSPRDVFAAKLAKVINLGRRSPDEPAIVAALDALNTLEQEYLEPLPANAFYRLAIADVRFDLIAKSDASSAYRAYTVLLNADLGVDPDAVRAAVFQRLVLAAAKVSNGVGHDDSLPAIVKVAQADQTAREDTPQALSSAASMLRGVLDQPDLSDAERGLALFALGRTLLSGGLELDAARAFIELAQRIPNDPQAGRAIDLGRRDAHPRQRRCCRARRRAPCPCRHSAGKTCFC